MRPHRQQPTRLPGPWDSPGKNTGVGCHFLLQCMKVKSESEVAQLCPTLATPWTAAYQAPPSMGFSRQEYWSGVPLPSPFPYTRALNSLTWHTLVSLTNNNLWCLRLSAPFVAKFYITWLLLPTPWNSFSGLLEMLPPGLEVLRISTEKATLFFQVMTMFSS